MEHRQTDPLEALFENNRKWSSDQLERDALFFSKLVGLQEPGFLWIGCSDSRVPANVITGLEPGEVFVHRNVANLVHPGDLNLLSVLEYAVRNLRIEHIIVCGHYGCGGVQAALESERHGIIDHWLQPVREVAQESVDEVQLLGDFHSQVDRVCELSVKEQVRRLARSPIIQDAWRAGKKVSIHGWIYDLRDGLLADLKCSRSGTTQ